MDATKYHTSSPSFAFDKIDIAYITVLLLITCLFFRESEASALAKAKSNIASHYLLVGLLERYDDFLKVLEKRLPRLFTGMYNRYKWRGKVYNCIVQ